MSRWAPDARERLQQAARELFAEQGFAATTVPEITARAGLTTRTFFRHFADKREVLFAEEAEIPAYAAAMMAAAPADAEPLSLVVEGWRDAFESRFEGHREELRERRELVRQDEGLQERELRKRADLGEVIRDGFIDRGLDPVRASLLAETSVTVMFVAIAEWMERTDDRKLFDIAVEALATLKKDLT